MTGKVFVCFLAFVALAAAFKVNFVKPIPRRDEHNIIDCDTPTDIAHRETVEKDAVFLGYAQATVSFPEGGVGKSKITCITVTDLLGDGNGGYPTILEGGKGFDHVKIHMKSQFSKGFKFLIEIYT